MIATIGDQRSVVSNMTLSVLEDSGWYKVNYSEGQLGRFKFGLDMGCSLFGDCNADESRYYCDEEERNKESLCSSDFYSVGKCTIGPFGGQCSTVQVCVVPIYHSVSSSIQFRCLKTRFRSFVLFHYTKIT
jgi:hypothetical protein